MLKIINYVTFIENGDTVNALEITGGEKYHGHSKAVTKIMGLVDPDIAFSFSFEGPTENNLEGKIQFSILIPEFSLEGLPECDIWQIYDTFSEKLLLLIDASNRFHELLKNNDIDAAIKLNLEYNNRLEKICDARSRIERDLILHVKINDKTTEVNAKKIKKMSPLTQIVKHNETGIYIDEVSKHNKSGNITVALKQGANLKVLGQKITVADAIIDDVISAYEREELVDVTVLNPDKISANKLQLTGQIIEITRTPDLFAEECEF